MPNTTIAATLSGGATSPPPPARCTTPGTRPTAARPRSRLRAVVLVPSSDRDPPAGLDPGPEPRRHHHRLEQGQTQDPAQPRTPGPAGVKSPGAVPLRPVTSVMPMSGSVALGRARIGS